MSKGRFVDFVGGSRLPHHNIKSRLLGSQSVSFFNELLFESRLVGRPEPDIKCGVALREPATKSQTSPLPSPLFSPARQVGFLGWARLLRLFGLRGELGCTFRDYGHR